MKKIVLALVGVGLSFNLFAADIDLEAVMKEINLNYKKAARAETVEDMQSRIDNIDVLIEKAKQGDYSPERNELYQEGFEKLTVAFAEIDETLANGDIDAARGQLKEINSLKKEYHRANKQLD
ncbi:cytochrome b562 [Vibrio sp. RC27]